MKFAARRYLASVAMLGCLAVPGHTQADGHARAIAQPPNGQTGKVDQDARPLPDIPTLIREVAVNQRTEEKISKDYIYHEVQTARQIDGHGGIKKSETREFDVFWIDGVPVRRMTAKDGRPLSANELKKQDERIDLDVAKAKERRAKADAQGKQTGPRGEEIIPPSRFLELGSFLNARRVALNGRDTIAVDYAGDPKAKTRNRAEDVVKDLVGTVWVDEKDRILVRVEGHFVNSFKVGAGLVVNIQKGTSFSMQMKKVNGEVWLPAVMSAHGAMRALLFFGFNGEGTLVDSDYRKFKATSTILPGMKIPVQQ